MNGGDDRKGRKMDPSNSSHQAVQLLPGNVGEATNAKRARRLAELAERMDIAHDFHKGQIVRWKPGLRNKATPANNEVAIVREILAAAYPICASCSAVGSMLTVVSAQKMTCLSKTSMYIPLTSPAFGCAPMTSSAGRTVSG